MLLMVGGILFPVEMVIILLCRVMYTAVKQIEQLVVAQRVVSMHCTHVHSVVTIPWDQQIIKYYIEQYMFIELIL